MRKAIVQSVGGLHGKNIIHEYLHGCNLVRRFYTSELEMEKMMVVTPDNKVVKVDRRKPGKPILLREPLPPNITYAGMLRQYKNNLKALGKLHSA